MGHYAGEMDESLMTPAGPGVKRTKPVLTEHTPVRFPPELIDKVKKLAEADRRTVSSWIRNAVEDEVNRRTR